MEYVTIILNKNTLNIIVSNKIKLRLRDVPGNLQNVHLQADSAEYIIERR